jgi:hypothetical protein
VLITYDDRRLNRELINGIKAEIHTIDPVVEELKVNTVEDFYLSIQNFSPQIVIILGEKAAEMYRNYALTNVSNGNQLPSISVIPRYVQKLDDIPNNIGLYYEVPVSLCINKLSAFSGKKISRIGIIHRAYLNTFINQSKIACENNGLSIVSYSLADSDPNLINNINMYLNKLKRSNQVDALYIPDDEILLRPTVIQNSWKLTLLKFPMQVVVCNQSYLESSEGMSTLCVIPDCKSIGVSVGKKLKEIESAQWRMNSRGLWQATFYKSFYNGIETKIAYAGTPHKQNTGVSPNPANDKTEPGLNTIVASQSSLEKRTKVLITYDDRRLNKELIDGIKAEIGSINPVVEELKVTTVEDFYLSIQKIIPQIIIILGEKAVGTYKNYARTYVSNGNHLPSISIIPRYVQSLDEVPNNMGFYYEVPVSLCVNKLSVFSGKKISRIGIIHRSYLDSFINQSKIACEKLGLSIISYSLPDSDPNLVSNINTYLNKLKRANLVDALYIPNDEVLLRPTVIQNSWKLTLLKFPMQVVVCNQSYLESNEGMSTLCIVPDYKAIGVEAGKKLKELENDQWKLNSKGLTQAAFYKFFHNGDETRIAYAAAPSKQNTNVSLSYTKERPQSGMNTVASSQPALVNDESPANAAELIQSTQPVESAAVIKNEYNETSPVVDSTSVAVGNQSPLESVLNVKANVPATNSVTETPQVDPVIKLSGRESRIFSPKKVISSVLKPKKTHTNSQLDIVEHVSLSTNANTRNMKVLKTENPNQTNTSADVPHADLTANNRSYGTLSIFIFSGFVVILVFIFAIVFFSKNRRTSSVLSDKMCVLITRSTHIASHFLHGDGKESIDGVLDGMGFKVTTVKNMNSMRNTFSKALPDLVCIDWDFSPTIHSQVCKHIAPSGMIIIFFNIVDFYKVERDAQLNNVYYIGRIIFLNEFRHVIVSILNDKLLPGDNNANVVRNNINGDIFENSMIDFMQVIDIGKKSGCLIVDQDDHIGTIFFENGRIVYATTADYKGEDAVFKILGLQSGQFRFLANSLSNVRNVDLGIMETIMVWAQTQDEVSEEFREEIPG